MIHMYDDDLLEGKLVLQPNSSWEKTFSQINDESYYFHTSDIKNTLKISDILGNLKLVGYGREEETDYYKLLPAPIEFDTL